MKAILTNADHRSMATHSKRTSHSHHLGQTAVTILMAIGFLGLIMMLSYLFINGTIK
jgi:hypothetical protein